MGKSVLLLLLLILPFVSMDSSYFYTESVTKVSIPKSSSPVNEEIDYECTLREMSILCVVKEPAGSSPLVFADIAMDAAIKMMDNQQRYDLLIVRFPNGITMTIPFYYILLCATAPEFGQTLQCFMQHHTPGVLI